jgi:hypothetical protein
MHTLTHAIEQQSEAIRARLNESSERLSDHIERSTQRFVVRMATFLLAVASLAALIIGIR